MSKRRKIPEWARQQRLSDMAWITENLHLFWPAAQQQYQALGRGAIVVDTTLRPAGGGHPFTYYPQEQVDATDEEDLQRMVREYDPATEIVIAMLKSEERESVYRVRVPADYWRLSGTET
jgi:hypothetical protein